MRSEFRFDNGRGQMLAGSLELPAGEPQHYALFAHCFTCGKDIAAASRISRVLVRHGIAVLRFDFTGLGNSDGDFSNENFSSNVEDLVAAAAALRERYRAPGLLIGHSLGGAAVVAGAAAIADSKAVVTIGAPADPSYVRRLLQDDIEQIEAAGTACIALAGRQFTIQKQFVEDLDRQRMDQRIRHLGQALLVCHAPGDDIVGIEQARRLFEQAVHPKSFIALDGANHLLSNKADAEYVGNVIAAWASRYLARRQAKAVDGVRVQTLGDNDKFAQRVLAGAHRLIADEPKDFGGDDLGPGPYDFLLAGLGACTSMTLSMYARRKQWPLEKVTVDLVHDRVHAEDCEDCESRQGRVECITRRLKVDGPLDDAQKKRLLEIADKCPVHKTLLSHPHISTQLVDE